MNSQNHPPDRDTADSRPKEDIGPTAMGTERLPPPTRVIGLTGGTGVGKTTVAGLLAQKGAVIVDCDQLGRDVVAPGGAALPALFERFGPTVRTDDGTLDRAGLAAIVFNDSSALDDLNKITHPAIDVLIEAAIRDAAGDRATNDRAATEPTVVVLDMAVLVETSLGAGLYENVVVVESVVDLRLERLAGRGMSEEDARARMASQATDDERRAVADFLVTNSGSLAELQHEVDHLWTTLTAPPI